MVVFNWDNASKEAKEKALLRAPVTSSNDIKEKVKDIFLKIENEGDTALKKLTMEFDSVDIPSSYIDLNILPEVEIEDADKAAIIKAIENIKSFHEAQTPTEISIETQKGVNCKKVWRAIEDVGLYIPGGSAPLISTLLMLVIPAQIANCKNIILITPPQKGENIINPSILFAAKYLGLKKIYLGGGAQAIAALTFGTETIPKVNKIFGPGNIWVTEAKRYATSLSYGPAMDMPAGPSEVMVIADETANAEFVAADLLAQAEHDPLAETVLVASSNESLALIKGELELQLELLPRREIARKALKNSKFIVAKTREQTLEIANSYAPEHLILNVLDAKEYLPNIINAGSIFVGPFTPEAAGDYASGTNHVLPTSGFAKSYSGLGTDAFMKSMTIQSITSEGLKDLGPVIERLARLEGLEGHAQSITKRLESLNNDL